MVISRGRPGRSSRARPSQLALPVLLIGRLFARHFNQIASSSLPCPPPVHKRAETEIERREAGLRIEQNIRRAQIAVTIFLSCRYCTAAMSAIQ